MKYLDHNSDDADGMDNESLDQVALNRTRELLKATVSSPDFSSAAELYLMIRMTVALAPSRMRPREAVEQVLSGLSTKNRTSLRNSLLKSAADALDDRSRAIEMLQKVRDDLLRVLPPEQKVKFGVQADPRLTFSGEKEGC